MRYLFILILVPCIQFVLGKLLPSFIPDSFSYWKMYLVVFLQQFFSFCVPVLFIYPKEKYLSKKDCTFYKKTDIFRLAAIGICLQILGTVLNMPIGMLLQHFGHQLPAPFPIPKTALEFLAQTLAVCLAPAIMEEIFFRRIVFNEISVFSKKAAVFFSALLFSMAHFSFFNMTATFFIGLTLGLLRCRNVSVLGCIITHFTVNFSASLINMGFKNPVFSELFQRYYPLSVFLALVLLFVIFPKKEELADCADKSFVVPRKNYFIHLLKNPLFYIYCILFCVLGVYQLC